jgi:hypothetical protein
MNGLTPWADLPEETKLYIYRHRKDDPRLPEYWRPPGQEGRAKRVPSTALTGRGIRPWDKLSEARKTALFREGSPRVPPGWAPDIPPGKGNARKTGHGRGWKPGEYQNPAAVIVPLSSDALELAEEDLWTILETSWDYQEISPVTVIFEANGVRLKPIKNPRYKEGKLDAAQTK